MYKAYQKDPSNFNLANVRSSSLQKRRQDELMERMETTLKEFLDVQKTKREHEEEVEASEGIVLQHKDGYHTTPDGVRPGEINL